MTLDIPSIIVRAIFLWWRISTGFCESIDFDKACSPPSSQTLTADEGEIYSPGFKENKTYPPNSHCVFLLSLLNKKNIIIEVKFMDLEPSEGCEKDSVLVYIQHESMPVSIYCGSDIPITERLLIFARDTEILNITFNSNSIISGRGFLLHYKYTTKTSLCGRRELQCRNSKCVPSSAICNQKDDCGDGSDEEDCREKIDQKDVKCGLTFENADTRIESRIVGGKEAMPGAWPWQIDLHFDIVFANYHICGGSLISSQWVVTARHCLNDPFNWRIHLGSHHAFHKDDYEKIRYSKSIHTIDGYSLNETDKMDKDIALIHLNAEVEFNKHIRPVCLPQENYQIKAGTICYTSGWGMTRGSGATGVLKQVPLKILETCNTSQTGIKFNPRTMICASVYNNNGGPCHADSGGPLVCQVDGKWLLIGITSFGTGFTDMESLCGVENIPVVYQKVSPHIEWIDTVIKAKT